MVKRNFDLGVASIEEPLLVIYINLLHCQLLLCHFHDMVAGARLNFEVYKWYDCLHHCQGTMVIQVLVPHEYELSLLSTEYEDAYLDKKNSCGDNNKELDDLTFHKSDKKKICLEI